MGKESAAASVLSFTRHASRVILIGFAALLLGAAAPDDKRFVPGQDGWLTLVDGSDLSRWTPAKGSDWALKDGVLTGTKGEITNYWHWVDFELTATVRGAGSLRFRVSLAPMLDQPGYRLDLADGTLRAADGRVLAKGAGEKTGDWHTLKLTASKGRFTVEAPGKKLAEVSDAACPAKGYFAFVADGQPLAVKLIRVRPLNREKLVNVPSPDTACFVCHANFEKEKIALKHASEGRGKHEEDEDDEDEKYLRPAKDRPKRNGCAGCHGTCFDHRSDEDNVTTPDVMYTRAEVVPACLACHIRHKAETKRKDGKGAPPPNPVCTDCHGHHSVRE